MRIRTREALKTLDRWLSRPALAVGRLLPRPARAQDERPLIVRPGGMGDLICMCMALESLGLDPRTVSWLIETRSRPWADHLGLGARCYDAEPLATLREAGRYRVVVNSEQRYGLAQATALALTGRGGRVTCFDSNRGRASATAVVPFDDVGTHEVRAFQRLLIAGLGLSSAEPSLQRPRLRPASGPPIVAIAGLQYPTRRLPQATWVRIARHVVGGRQVAVCSAPEDRAFAREVQAALGSQAQLLEGSFSDLCQAIARAERLLTLEGGMLHVASYYGVPATAIFTSSPERKWAPLAAGSAMIRTDGLPCQPCSRFGHTPPCPHDLACQRLDPERHLRAVP